MLDRYFISQYLQRVVEWCKWYVMLKIVLNTLKMLMCIVQKIILFIMLKIVKFRDYYFLYYNKITKTNAYI